MKKIRSFCLLIPLISLFLGGCAHKDTNRMILENNASQTKAMYEALSNAQTSEAVLAISILAATGTNQQHIFRDETFLDYLKVGLPFIQYTLPYWGSGSHFSGGIEAGRDVYVESIRADSKTLLQSTEQNYLSGGSAWIGSNDQAVVSEHDGGQASGGSLDGSVSDPIDSPTYNESHGDTVTIQPLPY